MRTTPNNHIYSVWAAGGDFVGSNAAPHGRVTVEAGWVLRKSSTSTPGSGAVGSTTRSDRGPLRWFQRSDNSQVEREIPNVKSIEIDRSIDNDSATCTIVMSNQRMLPDGEVVTGTAGESVGQPGFYWPGHGDSTASQTRWGWETNAWNDTLQPNALIRTYQGYGGKSKEIDDAISDGNIIQTGIWLVDDVKMDAGTGDLTMTCRDMAKLLIEQVIYPPLVPTSGGAHYPLTYYRWVHKTHNVIPYGDTIYKVGYTEVDRDDIPVTASSQVSGHAASFAKDGADPDTYWLSNGHTVQTAYEWIQFQVDDTVEGINIQPFGGNYIVYASVQVGGTWQGTNLIPNGSGVAYVTKFGLGWEGAQTVDLGGTYDADYVRLTFSNLSPTSIGGANSFRAGVRDFSYGVFSGTATGGGRIITGIWRGYNTSTAGYWMCGSDGGVFTFGNLHFWGSRGKYPTDPDIVGMHGSGDGKGYRLVAEDGGVFCFGTMRYYGSLPSIGVVASDVVGIENGDAGTGGYYILTESGAVYSFGDATYHGNHSGGSVVGMAVKAGGYWTVDLAGVVEAHGSAVNYGSVGASSFITAIEATPTGLGYWCVDILGAVFAFGDANYYGGANTLGELGGFISDMTRTHTGDGYWLVGEDGGVFSFGDARFYGSLPEQYSAVRDGNYDDYSDIVKDLLLWSGWWFYNPALVEATPPNVFGNIETTGVFAPEDLTEDFFDQKPVIDVINALKEIVGYVAFADEIGAYQFRLPNVWSIGNFLDTGPPTAVIPVIDEAKQITSYSVDMNDTDARSQIIIGTADPQANMADTKSVTINSQWGAAMLRGILRPALWVNGQFLTEEIQRTMANLIDLHLFLAQRQGSVTMPACPIIQIDDQVRIYERSTSETYVHYVRGYKSSMDLVSGRYEMSLQTNWLGDGTAWFLTY